MSLVANLAVGLTATTGAFRAGMKAAESPVRDFTNVITSAQAKIAGLFAGAAAGFGLGSIVKDSYQSIDVMAKLSDRTQTSTQSLMALKLGADLAGIGLDELTGSVGKLQKNLGDPSKEFQDALGELGLRVQDLIGRGSSNQMEILADRFKEVAGAEKQAAIAVALFGKSGADLIPFLQGGAKSIKDSADQAARLGLTFSRIDAAKIEAANDAFTLLKGSIEGLGNQIAIQSAGAWKQTTEFITDMVLGLQKAVHFWGQLNNAVDFSEGAYMGVTDKTRAMYNSLQKQRAQDKIEANRLDQQKSADAEYAASNARNAAAIENRRLKTEADHSSIDDLMKTIGRLTQDRILSRFQDSLSPNSEIESLFKTPRHDMSKPINTVSTAADQGTRGTYAGESASRLVGSHSVAEKHLKAAEAALEQLKELNKNFDDGLPVG